MIIKNEESCIPIALALSHPLLHSRIFNGHIENVMSLTT